MRLETFTQNNVAEFEQFAAPLTIAYKESFKRPPWNEASQCFGADCTPGFRPEDPGTCCPDCDQPLAEAYDTQELVDQWTTILAKEDGFMELEINDDNQPLRATLARPTTPTELFDRKYRAVPEMENWLAETLPAEFVWIEDTFSDLSKRPAGNLANRMQTIKNISEYFRDRKIVTRTLAGAIVAATMRDYPKDTTVYVGSERVGQDFANTDLSVPDRRTLLVIYNYRRLGWPCEA